VTRQGSELLINADALGTLQSTGRQVVEVNGIRTTARDPLQTLLMRTLQEAEAGNAPLGDITFLGTRTRFNEGAYRFCSLRTFKIGAWISNGNQGLWLVPSVKLDNRTLNSFTAVRAGLSQAHSVENSLFQRLQQKGPLHDVLSQMMQPGDQAFCREQVESGEAVMPICALLAALAVELFISPITTEVVPLEASNSVLDISATQYQTMEHCLRSKAVLTRMMNGRVFADEDNGDDQVCYVPVYVPNPLWKKAIAMFTALG
jgi:hypothetical protein